MSSCDLASKRCVPCEGGVPPIAFEAAQKMLDQIPGWSLESRPDRIVRSYKFGDFKEAMVFVNQVAEIAESEGHHPDIQIHYNRVRLVLWTHAIGGLSENDFILAAKVDAGKK